MFLLTWSSDHPLLDRVHPWPNPIEAKAKQIFHMLSMQFEFNTALTRHRHSTKPSSHCESQNMFNFL